jgi:predicted transcriptional regulator
MYAIAAQEASRTMTEVKQGGGRGRRPRPAAVRDEVPELHELEAAVMDQMWRLKVATVRQVMEELNKGDGSPRAYTTVLTVMRKLSTKGMLWRDRDDRTDVYTPTMSRAQYQQARASMQVEALVNQYGDAALASFARHVEQLSPDRLAALRKLAGRDKAGNE